MLRASSRQAGGETIHVLTVVGARPQFIKCSVVSHALSASGHRETLVHTGQHYDPQMSEVFFEELGIPPPAYNLGIGSATHGAQTGRMLEAIEHLMLELRPDWALVYGDTNSTLAGALAAAKLHIPIAHVEAGLRSFNRRMPEELNRIVADRLSDLLFVPTDAAMQNLAHEGISRDRCVRVGDVMVDVALRFGAMATVEVPLALGLQPGSYALATIHRPENTESPERLQAIVDGLEIVSNTVPVVIPAHPRVAAHLEAEVRYVKVIPPLSYLQMAAVTRFAAVVATDSGGLQKEAYHYRVPCVTLRDETEWLELLDHGWNRLSPPTDAGAVASDILAAIGTRGEDTALYGDGTAAQSIVAELERRATFRGMA